MPAPSIQNITTPQFATSGSPIFPFKNISVSDVSGSNDAVFIQVLDINGNPTDANGTFIPSPYIEKTGVGTYTSVLVNPSVPGIDPATLTQALRDLQFNPATNIGTQDKYSTIRLTVENAVTTSEQSVGSIGLKDVPVPAGAPSVAGFSAAQTLVPQVKVFSGATVNDNATNAQETITLTTSGGVFEQITSVPGVTLEQPSPGVYTLNAPVSPGTLSQVLNALTLDTTGTADIAVGLTISDPLTSLSSTAQPIVVSQYPMGGSGLPQQPGAVPPTNNGNYLVQDQTTGQTTNEAGQAYNGPVPGITSEFILPTTDQVTVAALIPAVFIQVGALGQPNPTIAGIDVSQANGDNVLDSYANSSFLIDGTGTDQNYLDARNLTQNAWSTVANFHSGDNVTVWGITQADFSLVWIGDTQGAAGFTGLTGVFVPKSGTSGTEAAVTLAGYHMADLSNGRLTVGYNTIGGTPYASIHAT